MAYFITTRIKDIYKTTLEKLRSDIGRTVTIIKDLRADQQIDCPNCGIDSVTKKSNYTYQPTTPYPPGVAGPFPFRTGSLCPICRGAGSIMKTTEHIEEVRAIAFIKWLSVDGKNVTEANKIEGTPAGVLDNADVRLKFNIKYAEDLKLANYVMVDGVKVYRLVDPVLRGLGDLSQAIVFCSKNYKLLKSG